MKGKKHFLKELKSCGGDTAKMDDALRELQLKARGHGRLRCYGLGIPLLDLLKLETQRG